MTKNQQILIKIWPFLKVVGVNQHLRLFFPCVSEISPRNLWWMDGCSVRWSVSQSVAWVMNGWMNGQMDGKPKTRTTRTPAFWGYPPTPTPPPPPPTTPTASWLPIPLSHIGSQVKRRQSQSYKFKKFAKILKRALHATHLLKLLDKMCKYEMDPMSIVEDTERTRFCPQTDRRTDGQGDTSIPPFQLRWSGGYKYNASGA